MQVIKGTVIKKSGDKTVKVEVERVVNHPIYKKNFKKTKNFLVHDEENKAQVGDIVTFYETKPVSKRKTWTLTKPETK